MQKQHDICTVEGCKRPHKARGYCNTHYFQWKRTGEISLEINTRVRIKPAHCTVEGCTNPVKGKGLCGMHWMRNLRHGHTRYTDRKKPPKICTFPGCGDWLYAKEMCHKHYMRLRKFSSEYGLTTEQSVKLLLNHDNVCDICKQPQTTRNNGSDRLHDLYLDHDHKTGKLRGFLCNNCNRLLGYARADDGPALLLGAIEYLKRPPLKITV